MEGKRTFRNNFRKSPMKRGRTGWKRWMRLTIVLASLASAPFLYSSCGGGGGGGGGGGEGPPTFGTVMIAGGTADSLISTQPNAATPDSVTLTIQGVSITSSQNGKTYTIKGGTHDVVATPGVEFGESAQNEIQTGEYDTIQLTISDVSWSATWSDSNPSPCDPAIISGTTPTNTVDLGGHTDFYFKTPDLGGNTLAAYQANPPTSGYIGDSNHPFVLASPVKVIANKPTTVNLMIGIGNTLNCNSLAIFNVFTGANRRTISGDGTGDKTGFNNPIGVYVDTTNNEIGVANSGNDSITIYDRTASGNVSPTHTIRGSNTRLSSPAGIALYLDSKDPTQNEIIVANSGNDSITSYDLTAVMSSQSNVNVSPKRSIDGYFTGLSKPMGISLDTVHHHIAVANNGNDSITIHDQLASASGTPFLYTIRGSNTGLKNPTGVYVDTMHNEIGVTNSGNDSVTIYQRNIIGVSKGYADATTSLVDPSLLGTTTTRTFTIDFALTPNNNPDISVTVDNTTTLAGLQAAINTAAASLNNSITATIVNTGEPIYPNRMVLASDFTVTVGGTLFADVPDFFTLGNVNLPPMHTIRGNATGLSKPEGITTVPAIDSNGLVTLLIIVANSGNNSVTIYDRNQVISSVDGNVAPVGGGSGFNRARGLYFDSSNLELGVIYNGSQAVMSLLPSIFPSSTNADPSTSVIPLSGNYNLIFYGVEMDHTAPGGIPIPRFFAERWTAFFDPTNQPPTFSFGLDTATRVIKRRIGDSRGSFKGTNPSTTNCDLDTAASGASGTYGVNSDGSFYAIIDGHNGTLQGTVLPDGSAFIASMYDSPNRLMLVYGVKATAGSAPLMASNTDYLFASYRNLYTYTTNFDPAGKESLDTLGYLLSVGIAETGSSNQASVSGDVNFLPVLNPTGFFSPPGSRGARYQSDSTLASFQWPNYSSDSSGHLDISSGGLGLTGALMADGATFLVVRNTNGCDDLGFGMGLRASLAGSFSTGSLNGTYFTAAFGDLFDTTTDTSLVRSTGGTITFDGAGNAVLTLFENAGGILSSFNQRNFTYRVSQRQVPSDLSSVQPQKTVDVVDLFIPRDPTTPYASALIGPGGQSLIFYSFLGPSSGTANPKRLLGLALKQTPSP